MSDRGPPRPLEIARTPNNNRSKGQQGREMALKLPAFSGAVSSKSFLATELDCFRRSEADHDRIDESFRARVTWLCGR